MLLNSEKLFLPFKGLYQSHSLLTGDTMKQYNYLNQLIVRYLFTVLAVVLLGVNVMADTVWNAGDATVSDLLTESNWSNGAPVTADNPGFINGGQLAFPRRVISRAAAVKTSR